MRDVVGPHPWVMGGDFNLIQILEEKIGGIRKLILFNERFREVIEAINLVDVRTSNNIFTWNNKPSRDRSIASRLDHFLVSKYVLMGGGGISVVVLPSVGCDHCPTNMEWKIIGENL